MNTAMPLLLIALSIAGLLGAMAGVHAIARRRGWSAELQRKSVHVATGLYALSLPLTFSDTWPVLLLTAVAVVVLMLMRLPALARTGIGSTIHGVERQSYGEVLLAVAVGFLFFRSYGNPVLFVLPMLVLTFSDAAAALTCVRYGRRLFAVEDGTKSFEGVVMFFLLAFILAMITLLLMTDVPKLNVILLSVIVAAFGAQLEADSWRGLDNLFVPVGLHLFLQNNLDAPLYSLLGAAVLLLTLIAGFQAAGARLGLTRQAARGYGVLVFLILSVTAPHNAILPLAAVVGLLALCHREPCDSTRPELDFLGVAAAAAALWLFLGEWSGHNAINLYNLTFAGVATVFATLALKRGRLAGAGVIAAGLGLAVYALHGLNVAEARWMNSFAVLIAASLALCVAIPALLPGLFVRHRTVAAMVLAISLPLLTTALRSLPS